MSETTATRWFGKGQGARPKWEFPAQLILSVWFIHEAVVHLFGFFASGMATNTWISGGLFLLLALTLPFRLGWAQMLAVVGLLALLGVAVVRMMGGTPLLAVEAEAIRVEAEVFPSVEQAIGMVMMVVQIGFAGRELARRRAHATETVEA